MWFANGLNSEQLNLIFKERASRKNSSTPENDSPADSKVSQTNEPEEAANNFIADIKNAAQQAQNEMGFIYEPTSGLYYDSRTGYYYNAVCFISTKIIVHS